MTRFETYMNIAAELFAEGRCIDAASYIGAAWRTQNDHHGLAKLGSTEERCEFARECLAVVNAYRVRKGWKKLQLCNSRYSRNPLDV